METLGKILNLVKQVLNPQNYMWAENAKNLDRLPDTLIKVRAIALVASRTGKHYAQYM